MKDGLQSAGENEYNVVPVSTTEHTARCSELQSWDAARPPPGWLFVFLAANGSDGCAIGCPTVCRGCGCMTAHEKFIKDADVPFCRR